MSGFFGGNGSRYQMGPPGFTRRGAIMPHIPPPRNTQPPRSMQFYPPVRQESFTNLKRPRTDSYQQTPNNTEISALKSQLETTKTELSVEKDLRTKLQEELTVEQDLRAKLQDDLDKKEIQASKLEAENATLIEQAREFNSHLDQFMGQMQQFLGATNSSDKDQESDVSSCMNKLKDLRRRSERFGQLERIKQEIDEDCVDEAATSEQSTSNLQNEQPGDQSNAQSSTEGLSSKDLQEMHCRICKLRGQLQANRMKCQMLEAQQSWSDNTDINGKDGEFWKFVLGQIDKPRLNVPESPQEGDFQEAQAIIQQLEHELETETTKRGELERQLPQSNNDDINKKATYCFDEAAQKLFKHADQIYKIGYVAKALELLHTAVGIKSIDLNKSKNHGKIWMLMAEGYAYLEMPHQSINCYTEAIEFNSSFHLFYSRACLHYQLKEYETALDDVQNSLKMNNGFKKALELLEILKGILGK
ncbi:hypothetical protein M3Y97_00926400 [Aphelenchoides bicaudatus]|nr:hypothetical protein M3Y97_00926400 [Aphelenchoides bicaudatus]